MAAAIYYTNFLGIGLLVEKRVDVIVNRRSLNIKSPRNLFHRLLAYYNLL